jgi:hypothetical protein
MTQQIGEVKTSFYAVPNSPHLVHTWCGYTLISLQGLGPMLTSDKVTRVTIRGVRQKTRPMGPHALMVTPSFKQEAQQVSVYFHGEIEAVKVLEPHQAPLVSPVDVYGFTPSKLPYEGGNK